MLSKVFRQAKPVKLLPQLIQLIRGKTDIYEQGTILFLLTKTTLQKQLIKIKQLACEVLP
jgi:hypothetical protein